MYESKEIREAIQAGERALYSLREAQTKLKKATDWGLFDIFGGDLLSGIMKHSRINEAKQYIEAANHDLKIFQRELNDVNMNFNLQIDISDLLTVFDFFFDGFIADYLVQSKISDAKVQVSDAIYKVEQVLSELKRRM